MCRYVFSSGENAILGRAPSPCIFPRQIAGLVLLGCASSPARRAASAWSARRAPKSTKGSPRRRAGHFCRGKVVDRRRGGKVLMFPSGGRPHGWRDGGGYDPRCRGRRGQNPASEVDRFASKVFQICGPPKQNYSESSRRCFRHNYAVDRPQLYARHSPPTISRSSCPVRYSPPANSRHFPPTVPCPPCPDRQSPPAIYRPPFPAPTRARGAARHSTPVTHRPQSPARHAPPAIPRPPCPVIPRP